MNVPKPLNALTRTTDQAIQLLVSGGVGVVPTDTIYGLAASITDQQAVERLYQLKHRERKPGTLIAADIEQLRNLGVAPELLAIASKWWPNPLSIVLTISSDFSYLHQGVGDIAIRIPADPNIRAMLEQTGPLITSSANQPGEPSSMTLDQAWQYFGDSVDFYVDGGDVSGSLASTIIRLSPSGDIEILRQGAFTF